MRNIKLLILLLVMSFGTLNSISAQSDFEDCWKYCDDQWENEINIFYNVYFNCASQCSWDNQGGPYPFYDSGWSYTNCELSCEYSLNWSIEFSYMAFYNCIDYCD